MTLLVSEVESPLTVVLSSVFIVLMRGFVRRAVISCAKAVAASPCVMSLCDAKLGTLTSKIFFFPQLKVTGSCPVGSSCKVQILFLVRQEIEGFGQMYLCYAY